MYPVSKDKSTEIKLFSKDKNEQFEKVSVDSLKTIPNLVKLDLNLDYLKNYLEDI